MKKLTIKYMIGDADGKTTESINLKDDNPFLDDICNTLPKFKTPDGYINWSFEKKDYKWNLEKGYINQYEYDLINLCSGYDVDKEDVDKFLDKYNKGNTKEIHKHLYDFEGVFIHETNYSFLTYQGFKVTKR